MKMSRLFGRTIREVPAEAEIISHKLLLRAGLVRKLASGIYQYNPLAWRSMKKIQDILRLEMEAVGMQEINMPVVQPAELWQESGRWYSVGSEMARFKDRSGRDMVLAITHEEAVTELVRNEINSYRQLPLALYQIQLKFRDEPRSRGGLIRVREFYMKDGYSFHVDEADLDVYYEDVMAAYFRIFKRAGLDVLSVESDNGNIGGKVSHEFMYVTPIGEDRLILCPNCDYAANQEVAQSHLEKREEQIAGDLEKVATPGCKSIKEVADFFKAEEHDCLKALFYVSNEEIVMVAIQGDLELNELKLKKILDDPNIRMATEEELEAAGIVAGYASPKGQKIRVLLDRSVYNSENWIIGANQEGYHYQNAQLNRDFTGEGPFDFELVEEGALCPQCQTPLKEQRGVEVGNIFKLGTQYSASMKAVFLDEKGELRPMDMGCYGIGLGRMLSCVIEEYNDQYGIIWPMSVAPYHVYLCSVGKDEEVIARADELYQELKDAGVEVLYDDRDLRPGVKFNDADLIGLPIRLVVSKRNLNEGLIELKERSKAESEKIEADSILNRVQTLIAEALKFEE
ncbi:MAG: proline--tRNA ligase [Firmicutes bacterium]|nr:proline--tRNA ligase [Bacillota bacterium]